MRFKRDICNWNEVFLMIKMMMTVLWEWLINDKMLTLFPAKTIEESPHHVKPQTRLEWELNFN